MSGKNDVVMIELDRPRELRFGHKALKRLLALTGKSLETLEIDDNMDMEELEKIVYCGLLSDARDHGETLTLEMMEDLLDDAPSIDHIMTKITEGFAKSFGSMNAVEPGNVQAQPKPRARSTGSNR